jgi:3-isopropylmalate dehydrogenase
VSQKRRKKVSVFHKSDELDTSILWKKTINQVSIQYPDIETQFIHVDEAAISLISKPAEFDVILADNIFGGIISSISSVIAGSRGMLPSASIGENNALFETVLGACPEASGKDIANPIGSILSAAMMLRHFGLKEEVEKVRQLTEVKTQCEEEKTQFELEKKIFCYEVPSSTEQALSYSRTPFKPTAFVPLSEKEVNIKIKAFNQYKSETRQSPHPRSTKKIKALKLRASTIQNKLIFKASLTWIS